MTADAFDEQSRVRLILLGASNVTRGIGTVVETAHLLLGAPLDLYIAAGLGRSYGKKSSVLFGVRSLPGILECGLWEALARNPATGQAEDACPTFALITDIGNDIMYGASPQTIASWVEECIERLQAHQAQISMTMLPIQSIRAVRPWQYRIVKAVLFPTRELSFDDAIAKANELHELILELAQRRGVRLIEADPAWYGFDPIHTRLRHWPEIWCRVLSACADLKEASRERAVPSLWRSLRLRTITARQWWLGPIELGRADPVRRLSNGTRIWMY